MLCFPFPPAVLFSFAALFVSPKTLTETVTSNRLVIIIGEVRGPEAFDMLQAMNTGHEG